MSKPDRAIMLTEAIRAPAVAKWLRFLPTKIWILERLSSVFFFGVFGKLASSSSDSERSLRAFFSLGSCSLGWMVYSFSVRTNKLV